MIRSRVKTVRKGKQRTRPSLSLDFFSNPTVKAARGNSPSVNTRATIATVTDWEGVTREVLSGENRFGGFRRVRNTLVFSEDFSNAAWVVAGLFGGTGTIAVKTPNFGVAPDGTTTACRVQADRGAGDTAADFSIMRQTALGNLRSLYVKSNTASSQTFSVLSTGGAPQTVTATTSWRRVCGAVDSTSAVFDIGNYGPNLTTRSLDVLIWHPQMEDVTGQSNQAPGEYQSKGVLSAPFQGANVDGVQYFATQNGNTVASNVVTEATGAALNSTLNQGYWMYLPGVSGNYASTPDTAAVSITGDIDIRVQVALVTWTTPGITQMLVSKANSAGSQFSYDFYCDTNGFLIARFSSDGATGGTLRTGTSSVVTGISNGSTKWVRATIEPSVGTIKFYLSDDGSTWTQLGTTQSVTAGSIFDSNTTLAIGIQSNGTSNPSTGRIYRAQLYNGIAGTLVADFNPTRTTKGSTSFSASTGETWTINGTAGAFIDGGNKGGFLPEPAATDLLTARADARDMTTANWTLGATMTRARTSVGADGVANRATRLTGGAVAATNIITTTITAAASSRTYSVLIKRVTGTGPVRITQDNFATSTDISSLINSSTYTLVQINQSQLNAQLGIKIDTNGDAIDADWNQFSAGDLTGLVNSRIPDTITTRNADVLTYATTGWLNAAAGTLYAEWFNGAGSAITGTVTALTDGTTNNFVRIYNTVTTADVFDVVVATVSQAALSGTTTTGAVNKAVGVYQLNDFAGFTNNATMGTDAAGTIPALTQLTVGGINSINQTGQYVRKISYYPTRLPNSVAQALTV